LASVGAILCDLAARQEMGRFQGNPRPVPTETNSDKR